jgi:hypothetical protein
MQTSSHVFKKQVNKALDRESNFSFAGIFLTFKNVHKF